MFPSTSSKLFEALFGRYSCDPGSFEVTLPGGEALSFQTLVGRKTLTRLRNAAHGFAETVTELNCPPEMRPFMTSDHETLVWVYFLGALCQDGDASDFLRLQHTNPILFDHILDKVQASLVGGIAAEERLRNEEAKIGFAPNPFGAKD